MWSENTSELKHSWFSFPLRTLRHPEFIGICMQSVITEHKHMKQPLRSVRDLLIILDGHWQSGLLTLFPLLLLLLQTQTPTHHRHPTESTHYWEQWKRRRGKKNPRVLLLVVMSTHKFLKVFGFVDDGGSWLSWPPFSFDYCQAFYVLPVDFGSLSERLREGVREIQMWLSKGWERILSGWFSFGEIQNLCPNYWSSVQPLMPLENMWVSFFKCMFNP